MVYKDKKVLREYKRQWHLNKKLGLPTNLKGKRVFKYSKKERHKMKLIWRNKSSTKQREKRKEIRNKYLGNKCLFCNYDKMYRRLICHKKDGETHKKFSSMKNDEFLKEMKSKKYVLLCSLCHKHVHWCMDCLNMDWKEIHHRFKAFKVLQ